MTSVVQVSVRFAWLSSSVRSSSGKRLRFGCLRTLVTRHMQRIANYRLLHLMLAKPPRDRFQISLPAHPIEREQNGWATCPSELEMATPMRRSPRRSQGSEEQGRPPPPALAPLPRRRSFRVGRNLSSLSSV